MICFLLKLAFKLNKCKSKKVMNLTFHAKHVFLCVCVMLSMKTHGKISYFNHHGVVVAASHVTSITLFLKYKINVQEIRE